MILPTLQFRFANARKALQFAAVAAFLQSYLADCLGQISDQPRANFTQTDGPIYAVLITNGVMYIGGDFTKVNGLARYGLAALQIHSGVVADWNPKVKGGGVKAISVSGQTAYVGGTFTNIGGQPRALIAAVELNTGNPTEWNPGNATAGTVTYPATVDSIAVSEDTLFAGGNFVFKGDSTATNLAAISRMSGRLLNWSTAPSDVVRALLLSTNTLYVGGRFTMIGGLTRRGLAELNVVTGQPTSFDPNRWRPEEVPSDLRIETIIQVGQTMFTGGSLYDGIFAPVAIVDSLQREGTRNWRSLVGAFTASIYTLAVVGDMLVVGGGFNSAFFREFDRHTVAALGVADGQIRPWNPDFLQSPGLGAVFSMATHRNSLYVGGSFDTINGQAHRNLTAFDSIPPYFQPIEKLSNASLRLHIIGTPGKEYQLESSTDLKLWMSLLRTNGISTYDLSDIRDILEGFYRVVQE